MDEITPLSQEKCLYFALVLISMQIYALVYYNVMRYNVESSRVGNMYHASKKEFSTSYLFEAKETLKVLKD